MPPNKEKGVPLIRYVNMINCMLKMDVKGSKKGYMIGPKRVVIKMAKLGPSVGCFDLCCMLMIGKRFFLFALRFRARCTMWQW